MSRTNKATQRNAPPMKKGAQRQNNSSKKTSRNQLEGARQRNSGIGRQQSVAAAYSSRSVTNPPVIRQSGDSCRVVHRELLSSIIGSSVFTVANRYYLNPGLGETFPWLSRMAVCWEQYKFHSLKFVYLTRTGSSTAGSFMLAPDYDAADAAPVNEQVASSYRGVVEDAPWKNITCVLSSRDLNSSNGYRYCRTSSLPPNLDIKTYDAGIVNVITLDGVVNTGWGKLWVEYDVELKIPQLPPDAVPIQTLFVGASDPLTVTQAKPLGVNPTIVQSGVVASIIDYVGEQDIAFDKDFHGMLTYIVNTATANQFTGNNPVITASAGAYYNQTEGPWTIGSNSIQNQGTKMILTSLITAAAGSHIGLKFLNPIAGALSAGAAQLSLTPCGL